MVIDLHGRSHRPQGLPQKVAGTYDGKSFFVGDGDLDMDEVVNRRGNTDASRRWRRFIDGHHDWLWMEDRLKATQPGRDGTDYRDEPVMTPEQEVDLFRRAVWWSDDKGGIHLGHVARALKRWFPNEAQCIDVAERWAEERLMALRRSCVADPAKCYSVRLAGYALTHGPMRVEQIMSKPPYNLSAHRMRVGARYMDRLRAWKAEHGGRLPNASQRDRIWDENMTDFVADKMERGVDFGRGMTYTNGHTADPRVKLRKLRRDASGRPLNARRDFETMLAAGQAQLANGGASFDSAVDFQAITRAEQVASGSLGTAASDEMEELRRAWALARERGLDTSVFADKLGVPDGVIARWEAEEA